MLGLSGGGKQVKWGEILKDNQWYLDGRFLLDGRTLFNPDRLSDADVREYWTHWHTLAKSGHHLTFRRVGNYKPSDGDDLEEAQKAEGGGTGKQRAKDGTPKHCKSGEEKITFLHSLFQPHEAWYHSLITTVASTEVCAHPLWDPCVLTLGSNFQGSEDTTIDFPAGCFSWKWDSLHSDPSLHMADRKKLDALSGWIGGNPHLTSHGNPASRATLLRICLGVGLLLKDANLIHYTEDEGHDEETPVHITQSGWGIREVDMFTEYLQKVKADISGPIPSVRYGIIDRQIWIRPDGALSRQNKRKPSVGDPAPAQRKAKKVMAKPPLPTGGANEASGSKAPRPKPKPKKVISNPQPDPPSENDESDNGEGSSNTAGYVLHSPNYKIANEDLPLVLGNRIAPRNSLRNTRTILMWGHRGNEAKRRRLRLKARRTRRTRRPK